MEPEHAVDDFSRRLVAVGRRRGCHEMIVWAQAHKRPELLDLEAVRRVAPLPRRPFAKALLHEAPRTYADAALEGTHECAVCAELISPGTAIVSCVPCDHAMHMACANAMAASYVNQGKQMPFACPGSHFTLNPGSRKTPNGPCAGFVGAYPTALPLASYLPRVYAPCPGKGCGRFTLSFREGPHEVGCAACGMSFCHSCRQAPHSRELPCASVVAHGARMERIEEATRVIDAVPIDALCHAMALQYRWTTGNLPAWVLVEREILAGRVGPGPDSVFPPSFAAANAAPPPRIHQKNPLRLLTTAELLAAAGEELMSKITEEEDVPPPNVLDLALASIGVATEAGVEEQSKFCPHCFVRIVRTEGCPSMRCTMRGCGKEFCYECLGPLHTHATCTKAIDKPALLAAAKAAGVKTRVVDGIALFSNEVEFFEALKRSSPSYPKLMAEMQTKRNERLLPLLIGAERLDVLTREGVSAPSRLVEDTRALVEVALDHERATIARMGTRFQIHVERELRTLAGSVDIRKYAQIRIAIAKERARQALVPDEEVLAAVEWHESVRRELAQARRFLVGLTPSQWLLAPCKDPGGTVQLGGSRFSITGEDATSVTIRFTNDTVAVLKECLPCPLPQPNQFSEDAIAAASAAVSCLVDVVLHAAERDALAVALGPPSKRPPLVPVMLRVGDVVVRGPEWRWDNQDITPGNIGVVCQLTNDVYNVSVNWAPYRRPRAYTHTATEKHVIKATGSWATVRPVLFALATRFCASERRALCALDAVLCTAPSLDVVMHPRFAALDPSFVSSASFLGSRPGFIYRTGTSGLGYYQDAQKHASDDDWWGGRHRTFSLLTATKKEEAAPWSVVRALAAVRRTFITSTPASHTPATTEWPCEKCTFNNKLTFFKCDMCHAARPSLTAWTPPHHASSAPGDEAIARLVRALAI